MSINEIIGHLQYLSKENSMKVSYLKTLISYDKKQSFNSWNYYKGIEQCDKIYLSMWKIII